MSWGGKTWTQWYEATQEAEKSDALAEALKGEQAAKWIAFAQHIENELDAVWNQYACAASKLKTCSG